MKQPFFSIIIPTLNEERFLPNLLSDFTKQTFSDFEIIHIDGNSDDKTVVKAKAFAKKLTLTQLSTKKRNVSHQRNMGGNKARGEWLIFMDADAGVSPDFLQKIHSEISHGSFDTFYTKVMRSRDDKRSLTNFFFIFTVNFAGFFTAKSKKPTVAGVCLGARNGYFKKVQFDEKIKFSEDVFFIADLLSAGAKCKRLSKIKVEYSDRRVRDKNMFQLAWFGIYTQWDLICKGRKTDPNYDMSGDTGR